MSAQPAEAVTPRIRPIDPDSPRGRAATEQLAQIFAGIEKRKAMKASQAARLSPP